MNVLLIVSATRFGQTAKISDFIKTKLSSSFPNSEVKVFERGEAIQPINIESYDAIVIGAPIYTGKFPAEIISWIKENAEEIGKRRCAFFSVSMNAADKGLAARLEDDRLLARLLLETKLRPWFVASFGGALNYPKYNFFIRFIMRLISKKHDGPVDTSRTHELTDWNQVTAFSKAFAEKDLDSPFAFSHRFPSGLGPYEREAMPVPAKPGRTARV